jgi:hypothetical protein
LIEITSLGCDARARLQTDGGTTILRVFDERSFVRARILLIVEHRRPIPRGPKERTCPASTS